MLTYSVQGIVGVSSRELEMCRMGSPPSRGLGTLKSRENRSTDNVYSDKRPLPVADTSLVGLGHLGRIAVVAILGSRVHGREDVLLVDMLCYGLSRGSPLGPRPSPSCRRNSCLGAF